MSPLRIFWGSAVVVLAFIGIAALIWPAALWLLVVVGPLICVGVYDCIQKKHAVLRNFPVIGHGRYWMEAIRPEIQQYFVESDISGKPFSREQRSVVYQRAKDTIDTRPFGTVRDLQIVGNEWIAHSLAPIHPEMNDPRVSIGDDRCEQPYAASLLNISAMSYGSLSSNAVLALNGGAKLGGFAHNTGEGGISPYHLEPGGDLVWQIGTGYFGCRTTQGDFDADLFAQRAALPNVKMIEVKLSQGAKPGHGGILPAAKVTPEISEIRGVPMGQDVVSPPYHRAFSTPLELLHFVDRLRTLSGGKPIGFKLCIGHQREFLAICKAMVSSHCLPDFITIDGAEGGTGAAPMEFSNSIGMPLTDGLVFAHSALLGSGLRDQIRIIASGKIVTGFNLVQRIAIGADLCNSARPMMFALGCIQALKCNTNHCPVGVATQNPDLVRGLDIADKRARVFNYHRGTIQSFLEILGAGGLRGPTELKPEHIQRRVGATAVKNYAELYDYLPSGALRSEPLPAAFADDWLAAAPDRF